jgi:N-acetylglucosaminyldiphosphoundecaprenol N-acetyl-beta-D-mannosaminyltransferase
VSERLNVLGVGVSAINMHSATATIDDWIARREQRYICVTGVHGIMESHHDPAIRNIHNSAGLVTPDGMPLVWLLKAAGFRHATRVYGPDLMLAVFEAGMAKRYRHFLYGSTPATLERLSSSLRDRFPECEIVGSISPPFRPVTEAEMSSTIDMINRSQADIVWVGLSTPKQERWMADHRRLLASPVLIGVGAAFDFHAGMVRQAPRLIQRAGLEWLFRMAMEPRRLWRRYLTNNPKFVFHIAAQLLGARQYPKPM